MSAGVAFFLILVYNAGIGAYASRQAEQTTGRWRRSALLRWGLAGGALPLYGFLVSDLMGGGAGLEHGVSPFVAFPVMAMAALTFVPYGVLMFGNSLSDAKRWLFSEDQVRIVKTYDQAEAAEKRHDWERATELYAREVDADPTDLEARRRLAEVLIRRGRPGEAAAQISALLPQVGDPEMRLNLGFRLADLHAGLGDRGAAHEVLTRTAFAVRGTKWEKFAQERLARLTDVELSSRE